MGMGHVGATVMVPSTEWLKNIVGKELQNFYNSLEKDCWTIEEIAMDAQNTSSVYDRYMQPLQKAFTEKTGLTLHLGYHDPDSGDCYDDIEYEYWYIEGMYQLSPAGEKYQQFITQKSFVVFG